MLIIGAVAMMAAIPILVWTLLSNDGTSKVKASDLVGRGGGVSNPLDFRAQVLNRSKADRAAPGLEKLLKKVRRLTPHGWSDEMEQRLASAGMNTTWTAEKVLTVKAIGLVIGTAISAWCFSKGITSKLNLAGFLIAAPLGFFLADILIKNAATKRQAMVLRSLPDFLDQITVGVEAGLGFDAAMARSAKSNEGPLAEELLRTLQHVQAGLSRAEALRGLANRNKVIELRQFVAAILQAEQFGIPMAQVLRVQAQEQRRKRRQRAEEKAMKLPVKVLFPLVLCILPALFVVLIGPAALQIKNAKF